jgi:hypothetical protein
VAEIAVLILARSGYPYDAHSRIWRPGPSDMFVDLGPGKGGCPGIVEYCGDQPGVRSILLTRTRNKSGMRARLNLDIRDRTHQKGQ